MLGSGGAATACSSGPREPAFGVLLVLPADCQKEQRKTALVIAPRTAELARSTQPSLPKPYRIACTHPCPPGSSPIQALRREQHCPRAYYCVRAPPRPPQRPCMRSSGVVPHTKLPRPTEVYRSVVCTYFCAALLWRVLATVLETCSLSELLRGRAIRAVPSLGAASYKTCHKHGARSRH